MRKAFLVGVPVLAACVLSVLALSSSSCGRSNETLVNELTTDGGTHWGRVVDRDGSRFLVLGGEYIPYAGEPLLLFKDGALRSSATSDIDEEDFPVVLRYGMDNEPAVVYRVNDGAVLRKFDVAQP